MTEARNDSVALLRRTLAGDSSIPGRARRAGEAMLGNGKLCCYGTNTEIAGLARISYRSLTSSFRDLEQARYGKHFTNRARESVWLWHAQTKLSPDFNKLAVCISNLPEGVPMREISNESVFDDALQSVMSSGAPAADRYFMVWVVAGHAHIAVSSPRALSARLVDVFGDIPNYTTKELYLSRRQAIHHLGVAEHENRPSIGYWRGLCGQLRAELKHRNLPY